MTIQPRSAYDPASVLSIGGRISKGTDHTATNSPTLRGPDPDRGRAINQARDRSAIPKAMTTGYSHRTNAVIVFTQSAPRTAESADNRFNSPPATISDPARPTHKAGCPTVASMAARVGGRTAGRVSVMHPRSHGPLWTR